MEVRTPLSCGGRDPVNLPAPDDFGEKLVAMWHLATGFSLIATGSREYGGGMVT
jgi:hypothetical protein